MEGLVLLQLLQLERVEFRVNCNPIIDGFVLSKHYFVNGRLTKLGLRRLRCWPPGNHNRLSELPGRCIQPAYIFFPRLLTMQKMPANLDKNLNRLCDPKASFHRHRRKFLTRQFLCVSLPAATTYPFLAGSNTNPRPSSLPQFVASILKQLHGITHNGKALCRLGNSIPSAYNPC